jgi:hypothetical protein
MVEESNLPELLEEFGIKNVQSIEPYGNGLINSSWKVTANETVVFLQRINEKVFPDPGAIATNLQLLGDSLSINHPDYLFVVPIQTRKGKPFLHVNDREYYRLFPFIKDSRSFDIVETENQAYEAARQFGMFTKKLALFPYEKLKVVLPDFHNLLFRHRQFTQAISSASGQRLKEASGIIKDIRENADIVSIFEKILTAPAFLKRVTHHDTKISNVLFDRNDKGICVVDLDTVMPGYFISDFGDMMRTYLSPSGEEDNDFQKIIVRNDFFKAIVEGYLEQMSAMLNSTERDMLIYSGLFMSYMQSMRFLTDYLMDDVYYGSSYEQHNLVRASNQMRLFTRLLEKRNDLKRLI